MTSTRLSNAERLVMKKQIIDAAVALGVEEVPVQRRINGNRSLMSQNFNTESHRRL